MIRFGFETINNIESVSDPIVLTLFLKENIYQCPIQNNSQFYCDTLISTHFTKQCNRSKININKNIKNGIQIDSMLTETTIEISNVFIEDHAQNENLMSIDTFCINNDCNDSLSIDHKSSNLITFDIEDSKKPYVGYITPMNESLKCYEGTYLFL